MTDCLCDCCGDFIESDGNDNGEINYDSLCDECTNGRVGCCK